jgi:hypothetical protein
MHPLPHPEGNGTRPVRPDRLPTALHPARRVRPLAECPG